MRNGATDKPRHRLAPVALIAAVLACGAAAAVTSTPASAQEQGLHVDSPPAVLNDPIVQRCRLLAARRTDPKINALTTAVEEAAMRLQLEPVFDGVATCRAALARYPNEPKVIIAHYNASESMSMLIFGIRFPDSEEAAFALVLQLAEKAPSAATKGDGMFRQMMAFYLGSAYEYGVGTRPDRAAALKWYALAAEAGDAISKRELARLQAAKP
jgi:TPR repeat protein